MPSGPPPCLACASTAPSLGAGRVEVREGAFELLRCPDCGLLRLEPPPSPSALEAAYGEAYYGPGHARFAKGVEEAVVALSALRVRGIARHARPPARVLDVGCGRGDVLRALARRGYEVYGTERDERSARAARASIGPTVQAGEITDARFPDGFFDLATAWHVLEHLPDPAGAVAELARVLRPGGVLLVECPNVDSFQARLGRERWFHLDVPRHLFDFGARSLGSLLARHGFSPLESGTFSLLQGPFGLYQTSLNRLGLRRDALYDGLRRAPGAWRGAPLSILLSMMLSFVGAPLSLACEIALAMAGRGGVIRIAAGKVDRSGRLREH